MSLTVVVSQPYFFPWVGLYEQLRHADVFVHYDDVQFSKGHFQDRVQIKTDTGYKWMTVQKKDLHLGQAINQVILDERDKWKTDHIRFLTENYYKAPFRDEMLEIVKNVYDTDYRNLSDLTIASVMAVADYFNLTSGRQFPKSSELNIPGQSSDRVLNIVRHFKGDRYVTGMGALKYFDFDLFEKNNVKVEFIDYQKKTYPQLFGEFNPYVSALDLVANAGKEGAGYICSDIVYWKQYIETVQARQYISRK